ncbi:MAG: hypothetical protein ACXW18_12785 [Pyrinomonadaceae bacterium]
MKIFPLLLICVWAVTLPAQDVQRDDNPPGITVSKCKWQPANAGPSVDSSMKAESDSPSGESSGTSNQESRFVERAAFVYSLEIKNDGPKAIKAIRWDYIILDRKTSEELGKHEFENVESVGRNKAKGLTARSRLTPTRVLPVQSSDKSAVIERVTVRCVVYEDGTLWQQPGTPQQLCEGLRRRAAN